jgi:iron complex transport system substrate-binding protein
LTYLKYSNPQRIICLTEEFTEIIYMLGRQELIVGISGFTMRPKIARKTKPKVCTYIDADFEKIQGLKPDLVFAFSDLQADICRELIKRGLNVMCFNQRSVNDILNVILTVGTVIGERKKTKALLKDIISGVKFKKISRKKNRPKVYFEEWDEPMISGIKWVAELVEICGGEYIFPEKMNGGLAAERIVKSEEVIERNPDIIIASWCGKMVKKDKIKSREGWDKINAVRNNHIYEISSSVILQPGPAALTDGVKEITNILNKI